MRHVRVAVVNPVSAAMAASRAHAAAVKKPTNAATHQRNSAGINEGINATLLYKFV